ncbi:MAG: hypothetical protein ACOYM3_25280 [Terrimicrobiaceae bacterium]
MSLITRSFYHIYGQLGQTAELDHLLKLGLICDTDFALSRWPNCF